jgi:hypothetical protein
MSVGKTSDNGTISIFTKNGVTRCFDHMQRRADINRCTRRARSISHPVNPTERPVATKDTKTTSYSQITASQQCLRLTLHQTSHQMDARSVRLPSEVYVDTKSHQSWQLRRLASSHRKECQQVLP